ncbi:hypothetical protein [Sandarakinorhabdus sp.]|uniref:hypothetical protein n=1 Tax=Sandarakinorhabdus sp. TaxID=1916663 RepID=UPI00286E96CA|nr:hypothetical protein [Sandarakinorhabdus sp.]
MKPQHHALAWQAPRPLWRGTTPYAAAPQILRFASDDFMAQLLAVLADNPARLGDRIARPETWRDPPMAADLDDPIARVPLPAPMKAARRGRLMRDPVAPPPPEPPQPMKLYQPAHQRYYVVAGSLACALPGLPEHVLSGGAERVHFVVRRLMPADGRPAPGAALVEYAHVQDGDAARWQKVTDGLAPGEELLPLFPLLHTDESGARRTLWGGLIPVGRREQYISRPVVTTAVSLVAGQVSALNPPPPGPVPNSTVARTTRLRMEVMEPWKALLGSAMKTAIELAKNTTGGLDAEPPAQRAGRVFEANIQFQMQSWLLILDLRKWIADHLPLLEAALVSSIAPATGTPARTAWNALEDAKIDPAVPGDAALIAAMLHPVSGAVLKPMTLSLRTALQKILPFETALETNAGQYTARTARDKVPGWPDFHFVLAGINSSRVVTGPFASIVPPAPALPVIGTALDPSGATPEQSTIITSPADTATGAPFDVQQLDRLTAVLARALPADTEATAQPIPHAMKLRDIVIKTAGDSGLFVIRMVHLNADCGPLHPPTLSSPSVQFRLASFFDPDAPVRPLTITLPSDTSPAGLRKHGRGTAFVMSDMLCGQVQRAKGLGFIDLVLQVLPWPFHKDIDIGDGGGCKGGTGLEIGMICSLSIPIITLCALILLMIMVTLFDFIFRWLPWFIACFPVPKLKAKP